MIEKLKRWWWVVASGPFWGAFAAHPCFEHILLLLLAGGITALGIRKQHCCVNDCIKPAEEVKSRSIDPGFFKDIMAEEEDADIQRCGPTKTQTRLL